MDLLRKHVDRLPTASFDRSVAPALAGKGVELLDMLGTLRCWTCGTTWDSAATEPPEFFWLCPGLCNADLGRQDRPVIAAPGSSR
jgi:hypothetical protein